MTKSPLRLIMPIMVVAAMGLQAQNITTPLFPYKDGEADATTLSGTNADLEVKSGSAPVVSWITYQTPNIDRATIASGILTLYVRTVTASGTLKIYGLTD